VPTNYTLLQSSGVIKLSELDTEYGDTTPIIFSDYYRTTANTGGGTNSGVSNIPPNTGVPTSGSPISLSDFYGTGSRYNDQTSITDTSWGTDDIEFLAATSSTLTGYTVYGSATGGTSFGTPSDTTLEGLNITSDATTTSGGIMIATDGPDAPYFYFYVTTGHADAGTGAGQIEGSTWTTPWYALHLERIAGGIATDVYYNASDSTALNGGSNLWGWYWDTNDGVLTSDIVSGDTYRVRKHEAGF
jgi:hypothetical protein